MKAPKRQDFSYMRVGFGKAHPILLQQTKKQHYRLAQRSISKQNTKSLLASSISGCLQTQRNTTGQTLKERFDTLMHELFLKVDFDCSGFITSTKISYYKQLPEPLFYFLGSVIQKIKQLGGVSEKTFAALCEEAYLHSRSEDIEAILPATVTPSSPRPLKQSYALIERRSNKKPSIAKFKSSSMSKTKRQVTESTSRISKSFSRGEGLSKVESHQSLQLKKKSSTRSLKPPKKEAYLEKNRQMNHQNMKDDSFSFESSRVRQLTERLDRQLQQSAQRLTANRYIR